MKFNKNPISITKNSSPWANDMVDIALIIGKIMKKDINFKFQNLNIRNSLDLFRIINPNSNLGRITKTKIPSSNSKNNFSMNNLPITSRVVALFNNEYRFISKNSQSYTKIDVVSGVPPNFNPNNENYSFEDLNKQLENSIYDFIMRFKFLIFFKLILFIRLIGKKFEKEIKYDQFPSPDEALNHPFLSQSILFYSKKYFICFYKEIDIRMRPSDVS